jgi:hypothetical protein
MLAGPGIVLLRKIIRVQSRCQGETVLAAVEPQEIALRANGGAVFDVAVGAGGVDAEPALFAWATL